MIALLPLAFLVAGCASEIPSPLGADAIKTMRLTDVAVTVAPDAIIWWGNAEHEYVAAHNASAQKPSKQPVVETGSLHDPVGADTAESNALAATPEGKAFVRAKAASRVKDALDTGLKPALQSGTRPVKLEVTVHAFSVPSAIQRVLVGGQPVLNASAVLKDATTGEVLVSRPNTMAMAMSGNGWAGVLVDQALSDLDVRLAESYAEQYRKWLLHEA
jgi:hypothetical protein